MPIDKSEAFSELIVTQGDYRVVWEYIGEGLSGDYNPDDPEDYPHLRFSCDRETCTDIEEGNYNWEQMVDGSYCTRLPASTEPTILAVLAVLILEIIRSDSSYKRQLEEFSWVTEQWALDAMANVDVVGLVSAAAGKEEEK